MTEEHAALGAAVRGLVTDDRGPGADLWVRLCKEIGVAGLTVPERYGGAGAGLAEAGVVLAELGRVLSPAPMLGSLLATSALLASDDDEARARLLPDLCAGDRIATVAWIGHGSVTGDGLLTGEFRDVLDAADADTLLVVAAGALHEVDPNLAVVQDRPTLDPTRRTAVVRLDGVPGRRLGGPAPPLRDVACAALAAEQAGTAARALELTLDHVRTRHQFGRPIGSFQVLQHRLADLHVRVSAARSAARAATGTLTAESAAVAKVCCSETLRAVAAEMVQMHGGIAITWEHDAHRYLRRAWASAQLFGTPGEHVTRLAPSVLDA